MQQFDNQNRGVLFKNDRREKATQPEYTGSVNIDGTEYRLSAWVKESRDGTRKFLSLSVTPKEVKREDSNAIHRERDAEFAEEAAALPF